MAKIGLFNCLSYQSIDIQQASGWGIWVKLILQCSQLGDLLPFNQRYPQKETDFLWEILQDLNWQASLVSNKSYLIIPLLIQHIYDTYTLFLLSFKGALKYGNIFCYFQSSIVCKVVKETKQMLYPFCKNAMTKKQYNLWLDSKKGHFDRQAFQSP